MSKSATEAFWLSVIRSISIKRTIFSNFKSIFNPVLIQSSSNFNFVPNFRGHLVAKQKIIFLVCVNEIIPKWNILSYTGNNILNGSLLTLVALWWWLE